MLLIKKFECSQFEEKQADIIKQKNDFIDDRTSKGYIILEITFKRFFLYNCWHQAYIIFYVNDN